jgi:hypothetical protein
VRFVPICCRQPLSDWRSHYCIHTREQEGHNGVKGLKAMAGGMTMVEGGRGAIEKRMAQIEERVAWRPATKVSMMGAADNGVGSG